MLKFRENEDWNHLIKFTNGRSCRIFTNNTKIFLWKNESMASRQDRNEKLEREKESFSVYQIDKNLQNPGHLK